MNYLDYIKYYLVAGHGVGLHSILFYLYKMGMPASGLDLIREDGNPDGILEFIKNNYNSYPCLGVTIDRHFSECSWDLYDNNVPVLFLVRDPIDQITSCINYFVGQTVIAYINNKSRPNNLCLVHPIIMTNNEIKDRIYRYISVRDNVSVREICHYKSRLSTVKYPSRIKVIDTSDISGHSAMKTMKEIGHEFSIPIDDSLNKIFNVKLNDFYSRLFRYVAPLRLPINSDHIVVIRVCPDIIDDFHFNFHKSSSDIYVKLFNIDVNGCAYSVSIFRDWNCDKSIRFNIDYISHISDEIMNKFTVNIMQYIEINLGLFEVIKNAYDSCKVHPSVIVECMKSDDRLMATFMRLIEVEISSIDQIIPCCKSKWKNYHDVVCG